MNNSKRSVIFTVAFITVMFIFSFIMPMFDAYFSDTFRFLNGVLFLILVLYPLLQMAMRYGYSRYGLTRDHEFFTLSIKENMTYYRLLNFLFVGLLLGFPIVKGLLSTNLTKTYITAIIIWLLITEALIQITQKTTKAVFCHRQLIIKGFDFRLDLPLGDALKSHSGVYSYKDFTVFTYNDGILTLFLYDSAGKVRIAVPEDMSKQVTSYLGTKKLTFKEHYRV